MTTDRKPDHEPNIDYSDVTPATGTSDHNRPIAGAFANEMPTSDIPAGEGSPRARPDKVIPGSEAASGVDLSEEDHTKNHS